MANEIRLRVNNISGAINDNPLLIGATTINSPAFADLPVVDATNHLVLVLDPLEIHGAAEVVVVTAHTSLATSVTVIRGQEGSTARQHPLATVWFHGPVGSDWNYTQRSALSTNRPTAPFPGELIYETDTNRFVTHNGVDWVRTGWNSSVGRTGVTVRRAAVQSIPDQTETAIAWDTEDFDSDGFITTPSSTVTIPAGLGGLYAITATGSLPAEPTVNFYSYISAGGVAYLSKGGSGGTSASRFGLVGITIPLAATNTISYIISQDHTGPQNFTGRMHVYRIGA